MIALLQTIVDLFVCWVQTGATLVFNAVIAAIAFVIAAAVAILPDLPDFPDAPAWLVGTGVDGDNGVLGWVAWVFPVHQAVLIFAFIVTAWIVWQLVAMAMRWARMLS